MQLPEGDISTPSENQSTNEAILWTFIEFSISCAHLPLERPRPLPPALLLIVFLEHLKRSFSFDDLILKFCLVTRGWKV